MASIALSYGRPLDGLSGPNGWPLWDRVWPSEFRAAGRGLNLCVRFRIELSSSTLVKKLGRNTGSNRYRAPFAYTALREYFTLNSPSNHVSARVIDGKVSSVATGFAIRSLTVTLSGTV